MFMHHWSIGMARVYALQASRMRSAASMAFRGGSRAGSSARLSLRG